MVLMVRILNDKIDREVVCVIKRYPYGVSVNNMSVFPIPMHLPLKLKSKKTLCRTLHSLFRRISTKGNKSRL